MEYAEKIAATFIEALNEKEVDSHVSVTAAALSLIKICRGLDFSNGKFREICKNLMEGYEESILDD